MLNCRYILKIVPFPPQFPQTTIQLEHSLKCLAQNQDRIKNVEVYRHFRICPPKKITIESYVESPKKLKVQNYIGSR